MLTSIMSPMSGILIFGYCPTGRAKKCVDVKSTPYAKHTASRKAGFTREEITRRASQFYLKINKRQSS
jgi:hypothetical protein